MRPDEARGWETPPSTIEPEDVGLFLPRALLFLPSLTLKIVFWPLRKGLGFIEHHRPIDEADNGLSSDERGPGILPILAFQSRFGPTVGLELFYKSLGGHGERVALDARFGGRYTQAYQLSFDADRLLGSRVWTRSLVRFEVAPNQLFAGLGDAPERASGAHLGPREAAVETRFRETRMVALAGAGYTVGRPGGLTRVGMTGTLDHSDFEGARAKDLDPGERSLTRVYDTSRLPGFDHGSRTLELDGNLVADTRDQEGAPSSGVYLAAFGGGIAPQKQARFAHYGADLTGYVNLYRHTRVLVLRVAHEAVAGHDDEIPFAGLPRLGGPDRLRGFTLDRFRDRTTAIASAEYRYPIHAYLAGSLFLDAGRAAPTYESLFNLKEWRLGGGMGVTLRTTSRVLFRLDVAYGDGLNVYFTTDPLRAASAASSSGITP